MKYKSPNTNALFRRITIKQFSSSRFINIQMVFSEINYFTFSDNFAKFESKIGLRTIPLDPKI